MSNKNVVVVGAGIVGVSAALWLTRNGCKVTLIDKAEPGEGASFGNAGIVARCSIAPVTAPGLVLKGPKLLLDPSFPLFIRPNYLLKLLPWLTRYLSHANDKDTQRIADGLAPLLKDAVEQHKDLCRDTEAEPYLASSTYSFAYKDQSAFEDDSYTWNLRRKHGFEPELVTGGNVQELEPVLGPTIGLLAVMKDHGFVVNPGAYIKALAKEFVRAGGVLAQANVKNFDLSGGKVTSVLTEQEQFNCDNAVISSGVFSTELAKKLGLKVPMEAERGYHVLYKKPSEVPGQPIMVASGKFVATPMASGLRCAGIVEFGGVHQDLSKAPVALLRKNVQMCFPGLESPEQEEWLGFRPAPSDSLPLIGEVGNSGIFTAFGHHHIGLTSGPKTGRTVADMICGNQLKIDAEPYQPERFRNG